MNVTDKTVSKWERGLRCPDVSILGELSKALSVGIVEILNGECNSALVHSIIMILVILFIINFKIKNIS